jgi:hypothetical protein
MKTSQLQTVEDSGGKAHQRSPWITPTSSESNPQRKIKDIQRAVKAFGSKLGIKLAKR